MAMDKIETTKEWFGRRVFNSTFGNLDRITVLFLFMMMIGVGLYGYRDLQPKAYDPLGNYPEQSVGVNPWTTPPTFVLPFTTFGIESYATLIVSTGLELLPVFGTKCTNSDTVVQVSGEQQWVLVEPKGTNIPGNKGQGTRQPGCQNIPFMNPIPGDVLLRIQQLAASGVTTSLWHLTGAETPISPTGDQFTVTKYYHSTDFIIKYVVPDTGKAVSNPTLPNDTTTSTSTTSTVPAP